MLKQFLWQNISNTSFYCYTRYIQRWPHLLITIMKSVKIHFDVYFKKQKQRGWNAGAQMINGSQAHIGYIRN